MHTFTAQFRSQRSAPSQGAPVSQSQSFARQRSDLTDQLTSLTIQRDLLNQQLRNADPAGQAQLQAQIKAVGDRTTKVMQQLTALDDASSKALAENPSAPVVYTPAPGQGPGGTAVITLPPPIGRGPVTEKVAIFGILGVVVLAMAAMRAFRRPRAASALSAADVGRLERLQQAVDVIAVEVERISEGQRFMSKALSSGSAEEIRVAVKERAKAP